VTGAQVTGKAIGIGLCLPQLGDHVTAEVITSFCMRAEQLGYSSLWVQDHFMWPLEPRRGYGGRTGAPVPKQYQSVWSPLELLTMAATITSRVALGTSVLVAGNHWPVSLAGQLATIDAISNGRLIVGLGVGWNAEEHDASGTEIETRGARMDDFIEALVACWGDDPVEHHGPFFDIEPSVVRPKPVQSPRPKLLSGMWSAAGLERTRTRFDAWNPAGMPVAKAAAIVDALNVNRPQGMAPLEVYHRAFAQYPLQPTPPTDQVERLCTEAAEAHAAGFTEFIIEHNFSDEITSPEAWMAVPERFAPVIATVA
jgi:probable F420-dependent oxidoreductase